MKFAMPIRTNKSRSKPLQINLGGIYKLIQDL